MEYRDDFDVVVVYRYNVAEQIYDWLRERLPKARIIFNNVDLHYLRERRHAELLGSRAGKIAAALTQATELELIAKADCSIVHTSAELDIIQEQLPAPAEQHPRVPLCHGCPSQPDALRGAARHHVPGRIRAFAECRRRKVFRFRIWPKLAAGLPADARLLIVGAAPTQPVLELANDRILVTGYVPELKPYFDRARVFVVPLRYGAGIKGKLVESLAHGVPSIATSIAVEGMGIVDGRDCIVADEADDFARSVLKVYNDPDLWRGLQQAGYAFVEESYSWARCLELCTEALDMADRTWLRRQEARGRQRLEAIMRTNGELGTPTP